VGGHAGGWAGDSGAPAAQPAERSALSTALRAWRLARARNDAVAAYIIFHDTTIEAIAARRPRTIAELRRVPGVGPTKLDRYGDEVIGVIASTETEATLGPPGA
jgi:ATP-dependent DNA helicase RecQ